MFGAKFQVMRTRRIVFGVAPCVVGIGTVCLGVALPDGPVLGFGIALILLGVVGILRPQLHLVWPTLARTDEIRRNLIARDEATIGSKVVLKNVERLALLCCIIAFTMLASRTF